MCNVFIFAQETQLISRVSLYTDAIWKTEFQSCFFCLKQKTFYQEGDHHQVIFCKLFCDWNNNIATSCLRNKSADQLSANCFQLERSAQSRALEATNITFITMIQFHVWSGFEILPDNLWNFNFRWDRLRKTVRSGDAERGSTNILLFLAVHLTTASFKTPR